MALGCLAGLLAALLLGSRFIESGHGSPLSTLITIVLTAGVASMAVSLWGSMGVIRSRASTRFLWLDKRHAFAVVAALSAVAALRESLESFVFLTSLTDTMGARQVLSGAFLGLVAVGLLAAAWQLLRVRAGLLVVFRISTVLLVLFSIRLALESVGSLLELEGIQRDAAWASALKALLPGGPWHLAACAALLAYPLVQLMRAWWSETEPEAESFNDQGEK
jgi:hypothetical protein